MLCCTNKICYLDAGSSLYPPISDVYARRGKTLYPLLLFTVLFQSSQDKHGFNMADDFIQAILL